MYTVEYRFWNSEKFRLEIKIRNHYVIEIFKAMSLDEMSNEVSKKKRRQLRLDKATLILRSWG